MRIHILALQHSYGARTFAENHRVQCDESIEIGETIEQCEAHGTAIETTDTIVVVVFSKSLKRMDTGAVIREQAVSDSNDGDGFRLAGHFFCCLYYQKLIDVLRKTYVG